LKDDKCIYVVLAKIGSAYYVFVSNFHSTRESLGDYYRTPSLEYFCDYLIRERDKLLHLGVIITIGTSNNALVAQHKDKSKQPKKQHTYNKKKNKGIKPSLSDSTPNGDKWSK